MQNFLLYKIESLNSSESIQNTFFHFKPLHLFSKEALTKRIVYLRQHLLDTLDLLICFDGLVKHKHVNK